MASSATFPAGDAALITTTTDTPKNIPPTTNRDLKTQTCLWYKIRVFVYDLRNFRENLEAQARLNTVVDPSYIGLPDFQPNEAQL